MLNMPQDLVGRTILGLTVSDDGQQLTIHCPALDVVAYTEADCCSHTWIESVEGPSRGFPATIMAAENIDMPDLGDLPGHDVMAYYGFKLTTSNGDIIIDYRNDSNGYYGGWLVWK